MYLVRKGKPRVYHLWNGFDTVCRMYSTGGMSKKKYQVVTNPESRSLCTMCRINAEKLDCRNGKHSTLIELLLSDVSSAGI